MTLEQLLSSVNTLSADELDALEARIAARKAQSGTRPRTVEEWRAELHAIAQAFRGDSSDEEMAEIVAAMNLKSKSSDKGL